MNKGVTLQGASEAGVVLTCDAALSGSYGLKVTANSATLKDFTLDGSGVAVFGIHVQPGTSNSLLQGLTAMNCVQNGISLTGTNDDAGRNILTDLTVSQQRFARPRPRRLAKRHGQRRHLPQQCLW